MENQNQDQVKPAGSQSISDPNQIGMLMLTIADRINESKDVLTGDIREFMTRVKELNALYAEAVKKIDMLQKQISSMMVDKQAKQQDLSQVPPAPTAPEGQA